MACSVIIFLWPVPYWQGCIGFPGFCFFTPLNLMMKSFVSSPMLPHVLVDFVVLPPGHGRSVTDF